MRKSSLANWLGGLMLLFAVPSGFRAGDHRSECRADQQRDGRGVDGGTG